jgi:hypothetical protein
MTLHRGCSRHATSQNLQDSLELQAAILLARPDGASSGAHGNEDLREAFVRPLFLTRRVLEQERRQRGRKHAPEVECIGKGQSAPALRTPPVKPVKSGEARLDLGIGEDRAPQMIPVALPHLRRPRRVLGDGTQTHCQ